MKVRLTQLTGEVVGDVDLPIERPYPEVVTYGGKTYKLSVGGQLTSTPRYHEVTSYEHPSATPEMRGSVAGDKEDDTE